LNVNRGRREKTKVSNIEGKREKSDNCRTKEDFVQLGGTKTEREIEEDEEEQSRKRHKEILKRK
jgi:hypothetical protein